ncbi:hypothetical protein Tco_0442342 [Tanacetum coccineum]
MGVNLFILLSLDTVSPKGPTLSELYHESSPIEISHIMSLPDLECFHLDDQSPTHLLLCMDVSAFLKRYPVVPPYLLDHPGMKDTILIRASYLSFFYAGVALRGVAIPIADVVMPGIVMTLVARWFVSDHSSFTSSASFWESDILI